jgi:hypothetical protein
MGEILKVELSETSSKKMTNYLTNSIKKELFDDYLAFDPKRCGKLIRYLVELELLKLDD